MPIPEEQLTIWSQQGLKDGMVDTLESMKNAIEHSNSLTSWADFDISLQGSYANGTNISRDSDVDIIVRLDNFDRAEISGRKVKSVEQAVRFLREDIERVLLQSFGNIGRGRKALLVPGEGGRLDCDILPCTRAGTMHDAPPWTSSTIKHEWRSWTYTAESTTAVEGIRFFLPDGKSILNFPHQHKTNCDSKENITNGKFKRTVRMYKNARNYLIEHKYLDFGDAPSYYIEGMIWNCPENCFDESLQNTLYNTLSYIWENSNYFRCANGIHDLLSETHFGLRWPRRNFMLYLKALRKLWNNWEAR